MLIDADVDALPWELFCLGFRQLTCWRDCLTFSGSLCLSSPFLNKSQGDQQKGSTLALTITYHAQRCVCLSVVTDLALLRQLVTFIIG